MGAVAALLDGRAAAATLRRTLSPPGAVLSCRNPAHLGRVLQTRLVDAIVVGPRAGQAPELAALRRRFPGVPLVIFGVVRPDDGERLVALVDDLDASALLLEGLDDPVAGDLLGRATASARRRGLLGDAPRILRLTEPLQTRAWEALLRWGGRPPATSAVAARLGVSREHLSRQFAAGGAPNLKRVVDFLRLVMAAELLGNPGHPPAAVARILGYSSVGHLRAVTRRVVRLPLPELPRLQAPELLRRFVRGGTRSRG